MDKVIFGLKSIPFVSQTITWKDEFHCVHKQKHSLELNMLSKNAKIQRCDKKEHLQAKQNESCMH